MEENKAIDIISFDTLKLVPNIIALLTTISIILSIVSNWVYFQTIMPNALGLLTINDQISFAISWVPRAIFFLSIGSLFGYNIGGGQKSPFLIATYNKTIFKIRIFYIVMPIFLLLNLFSYLFSDCYDFTAVLIPIYFCFIFGFINYLIIPRKISINTGNFIIASSLLLIITVNTGNFLALHDLQKKTPNATIQLTNKRRLRDIVVFREIQNGIIIHNLEDNKIIFFVSAHPGPSIS
ncbi:hypothetical protein [Acidiphilium sp. JA12-A1]|uniref:hypothetical protein n=1 Tax=Acidiphilium sp. JA12-A1 TaxID=1464546 RepID=UPI000460CDD3|nr:hypothetical protein [Acidiphilium sp. JA12-A1]KDM65183.1 hypothetical protein ACIDI_147c00020 [Acidiphilium sp. JA12-A1]